MDANNSSSPSVAHQERTTKYELFVPKTPVDTQVDEDKTSFTQEERKQRSHKGASKLRMKKTRSVPRTAKEGIMTGSDFVIPPELVWLRKSSLVTGLPSSISRYRLNRWIEDQILQFWRIIWEAKTWSRLGPRIMRKFGFLLPVHSTKVSALMMYSVIFEAQVVF